MKKVIYVDYENVNLKGLDGIERLGDEDMVKIFIGAQTSKLSMRDADRIFNSDAHVELITNTYIGKNALDFIIMVHMGYDIAKELAKNYYVISRDKGYDPAIHEMRKVSGCTILRRQEINDTFEGKVSVGRRILGKIGLGKSAEEPDKTQHQVVKKQAGRKKNLFASDNSKPKDAYEKTAADAENTAPDGSAVKSDESAGSGGAGQSTNGTGGKSNRYGNRNRRNNNRKKSGDRENQNKKKDESRDGNSKDSTTKDNSLKDKKGKKEKQQNKPQEKQQNSEKASKKNKSNGKAKDNNNKQQKNKNAQNKNGNARQGNTNAQNKDGKVQQNKQQNKGTTTVEQISANRPSEKSIEEIRQQRHEMYKAANSAKEAGASAGKNSAEKAGASAGKNSAEKAGASAGKSSAEKAGASAGKNSSEKAAASSEKKISPEEAAKAAELKKMREEAFALLSSLDDE